MWKVAQTILEPPKGNCLAACVASLLELHLTEVPNFAEFDNWSQDKNGKWVPESGDGSEWWKELGKFLKQRRLWALNLKVPSAEDVQAGKATWGGTFSSGDLAIATFPSPRFDCGHCAVVDLSTGEIVWDPHPEADQEYKIPNDEVDLIVFVPSSGECVFEHIGVDLGSAEGSFSATGAHDPNQGTFFPLGAGEEGVPAENQE